MNSMTIAFTILSAFTIMNLALVIFHHMAIRRLVALTNAMHLAFSKYLELKIQNLDKVPDAANTCKPTVRREV